MGVKDDYETAEVYTELYVDCPYCGTTRNLLRDGEYDQQICCCQACDKNFIMLA